MKLNRLGIGWKSIFIKYIVKDFYLECFWRIFIIFKEKVVYGRRK